MVDYNVIQVIDVEIEDLNKRLYLPKIIKTSDITSIGPLTTSKGKLFKNLTILEFYGDKMVVVLGNYKNHYNNIKKNKIIGFKRESD